MFTRERMFLPQLTGDWAKDGPRVLKAIYELLLALERPNALSFNERQETTPTPTSGTGTLTSASSTVDCTELPGGRILATVRVVITTNGTGASTINVALPYTAAATTAISGHSETAGIALTGVVTGSTMVLVKYDGTYPGADTTTLTATCVFQT